MIAIKRFGLTALAALMLCPPHASAISLLQAYDAALSNDPTYQAARHENEAGQENRAIGRASLLPSISANYSASKNKLTDREYTPDSGATVKQDPTDYNSNVASISLRQSIVNFDGIARYKQGSAQSDYSDAVFSGRSRELIVRVVTAYSDAQYAEDQLALATAQRDAYTEQMKVNKRMFEFGEATKTDMLETQAKAELAEAQVIEAMDNAVTARNTLAGIIGKEVTSLDTLSSNFPIQPMNPASIDEWKSLAMEKNAELIAQRHAVEAARQEVNKNRAGHFPRLDAVASYSDAKSESVNTYNQEYKSRSIGVQLSIPLFSGGYTNAATNQAAANHAKAKSELDAKLNQVMIELRKQYGLVTSSAGRIQALEKAVDSARMLITATEKSIVGGVRINLDLLNAQQQLFTTQRDLAQARYNYLLAYLRLRYAAGSLTHDDLRVVASYYTAPPLTDYPNSKGITEEPRKQDEKTAPEQVTPGSAPPQPVSPEKAAPELITPPLSSPESLTSQPTAPEQATPLQVAPEPTISRPITPEKAAPNQVAPLQITPESGAPQTVPPEKPMPEQVMPPQAVPESVTAQPVTPEKPVPVQTMPSQITPETLAPGSLTSQPVTPEKARPESAAPGQVTPIQEPPQRQTPETSQKIR